MADLIDRQAIVEKICGWCGSECDSHCMTIADINTIPAADAVSRGLFEQIKWERDIAMEQLTEHGIAFGAKSDPASLRPKGEWICNTDDFTPKKRCTNCGYNKPLVAGEAIKQEPDNYCPNCGADMRGETHDS